MSTNFSPTIVLAFETGILIQVFSIHAMNTINIDNYLDSHYMHRSNWLRAAVLGANDGIISISSLAIGVAAASTTRQPIALAAVAGLVAGALSMAAGNTFQVPSPWEFQRWQVIFLVLIYKKLIV